MFGDDGVPRGPLIRSCLTTPLVAPVKPVPRIPHSAEPDQEHNAGPVHDRPVQGRIHQQRDAQRRGAIPRSLMRDRAIQLTQALRRRLPVRATPRSSLAPRPPDRRHATPGSSRSRHHGPPSPSWQLPSLPEVPRPATALKGVNYIQPGSPDIVITGQAASGNPTRSPSLKTMSHIGCAQALHATEDQIRARQRTADERGCEHEPPICVGVPLLRKAGLTVHMWRFCQPGGGQVSAARLASAGRGRGRARRPRRPAARRGGRSRCPSGSAGPARSAGPGLPVRPG